MISLGEEMGDVRKANYLVMLIARYHDDDAPDYGNGWKKREKKASTVLNRNIRRRPRKL